MTRKSRYFLVGSASLLLVGLGGGLVAYVAYNRVAGVPAGLPSELRYVPTDAALVAYADVHTVMASELRRELERIATGGRRGQRQMHDFAGIDFEKDINHVVAYLAPDGPETNAQAPPRALVLAQGTFDQARIEQFIRDHGGSVEDYHGKHMVVGQMPQPSGGRGSGGRGRGRQGAEPAPEIAPAPQPQRTQQMVIGFVQPDLVAIGQTDLVRRALDAPSGADNVTSNADLMGLIRDASSGTAWVVGRFDAVSRRMGIPSSVRQQVPPLRLVSATAHINGGVKATIKAETADKVAADQLRDVVRGAISLMRLQAGAKPELQDTLKSIELGGSATSVQLSFTMTPETFRAIVPPRPQPPVQPPPQR